MKKSHLGLYAAIICILIAGQVWAETLITPMQGWQRSSQISGMTVTNPQGEKFGKINDLLVDPSGAIKYAVLSHGGVLGIGDELLVIPWRALKVGQEKGTLVLNVEKAVLEKAPNFDPKNWSKATEPEALKKIEIYYN